MVSLSKGLSKIPGALWVSLTLLLGYHIKKFTCTYIHAEGKVRAGEIIGIYGINLGKID